MRTTLPDEQGWYWCKILTDGTWRMIFVDQHSESIVAFAEDPTDGPCGNYCDADDVDKNYGEIEWHGPITCPGGDFGSETILPSETLHQEARQEKKVMAIMYFDFYYCREDGHGSSLAITRVLTRGEASALIKAELPG